MFAFEDLAAFCSSAWKVERCSFLFTVFPRCITTQNTKFVSFLASILPLCLLLLVPDFSIAFSWLSLIFPSFFIYCFRWIRECCGRTFEQIFQLYPLFRQHCQLQLLLPFLPRKAWCNGWFPESVDMERGFTRINK